MLYFATYFDKNYLSRGLTLYNSMREHIDNFMLFVLALDDEVVNYIKNNNANDLVVIKLEDIETRFPELIEAKNNRNIVEYYFTLSPILPLYLLDKYEKIDFITTLDADILFFGSPKQIFDSFDKYSILITKHNFTDELMSLEIYGKYNVSFQSFRRDKEGLACLLKWKDQCLEWCYDRLDGDRFADQKYLDTWTSDYENVLELTGDGVGIAPWNIGKYKISKKNGVVYCGKNKLIYYHFHGLRYISNKIIKHGLNSYFVKLNKNIKNIIYKTYIKKIFFSDKKIPFSDKNIQRLNKKYKNKDKINLLIFDYTFYFLFNSYLINIHFLPLYRFLKYTMFLPLLIIKRLINKLYA